MNEPKWNGILRHGLTLLGTILVTLGILDADFVAVLPDMILELVGSALTLYSFIKSVFAREKQITPAQYAQLKVT